MLKDSQLQVRVGQRLQLLRLNSCAEAHLLQLVLLFLSDHHANFNLIEVSIPILLRLQPFFKKICRIPSSKQAKYEILID